METVGRPWIGVDLDGTLAHYTGWKGPDQIGKPVPAMMRRIRRWVAKGIKVKIFTARAYTPSDVPHVLRWLKKHGLDGLEVTCVKDLGMVQLWDDRCVAVEQNTGRIIRANGKFKNRPSHGES
jgi:hypothetical protein